MAIMTARQGQHEFVQLLKNPKRRDRAFEDNPPVDTQEPQEKQTYEQERE